MILCEINRAVSTILNKIKKKSWNDSDREISLKYISQLQDWLSDCENIIKNKENTNG